MATSKIGSAADMRAVDLCCGAGGVTAGLKAAGIRVAAGVDNDHSACASYAKNHPEVTLYREDLLSLEPRKVLRDLGLQVGELELLTACVPCQTYSSLAVKNRNPSDRRYELVGRTIDYAEAIRPHAIVMENVPLLARESVFHDALDRLHAARYGVWYGVVDAADFGVPQRRRRLVVFALEGVPDNGVPQLHTSHESLRGYVTRLTVRQAFQTMANLDPHDPLHQIRSNYPPLVRRRIEAIPPNGGSRRSLPEDLQLRCHRELKGGRSSAAGNVYGRMWWDRQAPTLTTRCTTPSSGRFLHPEEDRAITLREAAVLQTFPLDYQFVGTNLQVQALIGNAVPPRLAEVIAVVVAEALAGKRTLLRDVLHGD